MKEIDNIVKKVLLESLNEKADEITNKIHSKLSGEMKEIGFKQGLARAAKKKFGKQLPKSLEDKFHLSDYEEDNDDMTDITSGEFDYVAEGECMEGDCGEMKENEETKIVQTQEDMDDLEAQGYGCTWDDENEEWICDKGSKFEDSEIEEELHGNQKKIDVAEPKGKITADDFAKLRKEKMNEKWEGDTEVKKTGEYSNMSVAQLDKAIKALKSKTAKLQDEGKKVPKSMREKMSELYFAKRAKQGWKGKGSAKVDEEMEEGNAFTEKLKNTQKGEKFKIGNKTYTDTSDLEESIKYSVSFGDKKIVMTEEEMINMIEEIIVEEKKKTNLKSPGKAKGMVEFDRIHKKDEDINKKANQESFKKMKDYVKAGSKGSFETNPKHFPKGNGELAKMDKKAYTPSDAVGEYIDNFAYGGGMADLYTDEIGYNEDWLEKNIEGSAMTGNSPEYANAVDTGYGKKINKRRKEGLYNKEKRQGSYNRTKQPVDVAGENTKSGKLNKMFKTLGESEEKENVLTEEMIRIKDLLSYNKKTQ